MSDVKIRDLDEGVIVQIDHMARKHHMSRNKYLKGILANYVLAGEQRELEEKYRSLVNVTLEVVQHNTRTMEQMRMEIQESLEELKQKYLNVREEP